MNSSKKTMHYYNTKYTGNILLLSEILSHGLNLQLLTHQLQLIIFIQSVVNKVPEQSWLLNRSKHLDNNNLLYKK